MRFLWVDTETTGIDPANSAIVELAAILVINGKVECERDFFMNPLNDTFKFNPEAAAVNGYTEDKIKGYQTEKECAPKIIDFFRDCYANFRSNGSENEKVYFVAYNAGFDWDFCKALLERHNADMNAYFCKIVDVYEQAKKARSMGILSGLENLKLTTVTKSLAIKHEDAHTALDDIRAARDVAMKLHKMGASLI